jgi:hypothetical protein
MLIAPLDAAHPGMATFGCSALKAASAVQYCTYARGVLPQGLRISLESTPEKYVKPQDLLL